MDYPVAMAHASERADFIRRTYSHLAGAILAFAGLEALLFWALGKPGQDEVLRTLATTPYSWLIVLAAFMGVGYLADYWARSQTSRAMQYLGLGIYVVAEALIFLPLLILASRLTDPNVIPTAGVLTLAVFGGLTLAAFTTKKDFSFLGPIVSVLSFVALGFIVLAVLLPQFLTLGAWFAFAMVALMSAVILYQTSQVMYHYRPDQHVAAALGLFASVATLFWYILQIVMSSGRD